MNKKYDAIIIGSGAGGAPVAYTLAKQGKHILVIEKGPMFDAQDVANQRLSDYKRDEFFGYGHEKIINIPDASNNGHTYYPGPIEPDLTDEPHVYRSQSGEDRITMEGYTAQAVGGGTQLYGGVSLRFTADDFRLKSFNETRTLNGDRKGEVKKEARDWAISYDELEPYYCKAEKLIGINGAHENQLKPFSEQHYQPPLEPNAISEYARLGMTALGKEYGNEVKPYRPPLAVITRDHASSQRKVPHDGEHLKTSYVNRYGDPLGAKSNTWVALLKQLASQPNFELIANCTVTHLEQNNGKITKVHARGPSGENLTLEAKQVIVACSAIESVRLLQLSATYDIDFEKRINGNGLLGKYFLTHCFGGASAIMPKRFDKSRALDADWALDVCATQNFMDAHKLWAGGAIYNNTSDQALPISLFRTHQSMDLDTLWMGFTRDTRITGQGMIDFLDEELGRGLSISFMANQVPQKNNRIELHSTIRDKWNRPAAYVIKNWHEHDAYLMNVMAEQCKKVFDYGVDTSDPNFHFQGAGGIYQAENSLARMANHILGGARFGTDPNDSVLDPTCRAWNFDNLTISDGAFMPTSGSANPTLTIQANAFRVADELLKRM